MSSLTMSIHSSLFLFLSIVSVQKSSSECQGEISVMRIMSNQRVIQRQLTAENHRAQNHCEARAANTEINVYQ